MRGSDSRIAIAGWSNNNAFTQAEDFHLLRTPLSGLNRTCTARDTLLRYSFIEDSAPVAVDSFGMTTESFAMDRVTVPVRPLCAPRGWTKMSEFELKGTKPIKSGGSITALFNSIKGAYLFALTGNNTRELQ